MRCFEFRRTFRGDIKIFPPLLGASVPSEDREEEEKAREEGRERRRPRRNVRLPEAVDDEHAPVPDPPARLVDDRRVARHDPAGEAGEEGRGTAEAARGGGAEAAGGGGSGSGGEESARQSGPETSAGGVQARGAGRQRAPTPARPSGVFGRRGEADGRPRHRRAVDGRRHQRSRAARPEAPGRHARSLGANRGRHVPQRRRGHVHGREAEGSADRAPGGGARSGRAVRPEEAEDPRRQSRVGGRPGRRVDADAAEGAGGGTGEAPEGAGGSVGADREVRAREDEGGVRGAVPAARRDGAEKEGADGGRGGDGRAARIEYGTGTVD